MSSSKGNNKRSASAPAASPPLHWGAELNAALNDSLEQLCRRAYDDTPVTEVVSDGRAFVRKFASEILGANRPLSKQIKDLKKLSASREGDSNVVTALLCPTAFAVPSSSVLEQANAEWTNVLEGASGTAGFRDWMHERKYQYAAVLFEMQGKCIIGLGFAARFPGNGAPAPSASGGGGGGRMAIQRAGTPIPRTAEPFRLE